MSERASPVAVVIIGAGAGTRFGGPKAEATLSDGRRFLDAIVETAKSAGLDPMICSNPRSVVPTTYFSGCAVIGISLFLSIRVQTKCI